MGIKAIRIARGLVGAVFLSFGLPFATLATHSTGHDLWTSKCDTCHTTVPAGNQLNAASSGSAILSYVITNQASMAAYAPVTALTAGDRALIAAYILTELPAISSTGAFNTPQSINVNSHIHITSVLTFTGVQTMSNPANGTLSGWSGTSVTYTPNAGFVGSDSFTYRGTGGATSPTRTVSITVQPPPAPVITSASTKSGTVGVFLSYTITATNSPTSYGASGLPPGITRSNNVLSGTPTTAGTDPATITASNAGGIDSNTLTFTIAKGSQSITFNTQATTSRAYTTGGTFSISPLATSSVGLPISYASSTGACSVSGTTVTMLAAGTCTIVASQAGNSNYNAATSVQQNVTITQGSQTITFPAQTTATRPWVMSGSFVVSPVASASSGLAVTYGTTTPSVCAASGTSTTVSILTAGTCTITANQAGNANFASAGQQVQSVSITAIAPGAPTGVAGTAGVNQASLSFSPPASNGGSTVTGYKGTCSGFTGTSASSPVVVGGLTNGVTYSCSVQALTTAFPAGGASSGSVNVTPTAAPVPPSINSANGTTFTVGSFGSFSVLASGTPTPMVALTGGSLPAGVSFSGGSGSGSLSGTPALGMVGSYNLTFSASSTSPPSPASQPFTLTIAKRNQVVDFTPPPDQPYTPTPIPLGATSSVGLPVEYYIPTDSICRLAKGGDLELLSAGECVIDAFQVGDANTNPASSGKVLILISLADQAITFDPQAGRALVPGGTFPLSPAATASSGLPVAYGSLTPAVCSLSGETVTMHAAGICSVLASQSGDERYNPAMDVQQDFVISLAAQAITFPVQAARTFSLNGTFDINPPATASSGLSVAYSSLTPAVCSVSGSTVTMLAVGTCTIAANQPGNATFGAAPQVTQPIGISPALPGAPTIGTITPGSGQASIEFTPPSNNGGATITLYTATCNPGAHSNTGASSPIVVSGLTNGQAYTCSVRATNSAGMGPASATGAVTPAANAASGAALWDSVCSACHGPLPAGTRFNAAAPAGSTPTTLPISVLNYVRATQPQMADPVSGVPGLSPQQLDDVVAYITGFMPATEATTATNVAKAVTLANLTIGTISFTGVEVVTPPAHGSLSAFTGATVTYTPSNGYTGVDTFVYRGVNPAAGVVGSLRTATITVSGSLPVLTVVKGGIGLGSVAADGIDCGTDCNEAYDPGTLVVLEAFPQPGSTFTGWSGDCSGTDTLCLVSMDASRSVTANFGFPPGTVFNLSVSRIGTGAGSLVSSPAGISCGATCSLDFAAGTLVTLTPTPAVNSIFSGWSGACGGTGACTVTMSAARSVTATFTAYNPANAADLSITQSANVASVGTGKDVVYTITTTNNGPASATSLVVTDALPSGASFVWASPGCALAGSNVNCNGGTLASGASIQFKVVMRHASAGSPMNNVSASAGPVDPVSSNNAHALMMTVNPSPVATAVLRYRLYSPVTLEHHFTTDLNEYTVLGGNGNWNQEGTVGKVLSNPGSFNGVTAVPYYRLYDGGTRWHHWTTDANEYYTLIQFPGWNGEGVDGYILPSQPAGATPLYRLLYPFVAGLHHWTIDPVEYNALITSFGWIGEGGSGFVIQ